MSDSEPIQRWLARQPDARPGQGMPDRWRYMNAADFNTLKVEMGQAHLGLATTHELLQELQTRADVDSIAHPDAERRKEAEAVQMAISPLLRDLSPAALNYRTVDGDGAEPDEENLAKPDWGTRATVTGLEPFLPPEVGLTIEARGRAIEKALEHAERAEAAYEEGNNNAIGSQWRGPDVARLMREAELSRMWSALL